jgi:hypothetical protein
MTTPAWSCLERLVVPIIDHSASMLGVIDVVRKECSRLGEALRAQDVAVHFIIFDDIASAGPELGKLTSRGNRTRIALAFGLLTNLLRENGTPRQLDVVFVSDGEDTDMSLCTTGVRAMEPPGCRCRLFSVGVGFSFPTTLVIDLLYPRFGLHSDPAIPPVIPMGCCDEAPGVFAQLLPLLSTARQPPPPTLGDFQVGGGMQPVDLLGGARRVYNACMHGCLFKKDVSETAALAACAEILARVEALCIEAVKADRAAPRGKRVLPSQLMALDEMSAADALEAIQALRHQVKLCTSMVERHILLSSLDNDAKRNIAGFAGRCAHRDDEMPQGQQEQAHHHSPRPRD